MRVTRLPLNNPVAAIPSLNGNTVYVVLGGNDLVEIVDVSDPEPPGLVKFLRVGKNPRGIAVSRDGRWGYVISIVNVNGVYAVTGNTEVAITTGERVNFASAGEIQITLKAGVAQATGETLTR